jgi:hypothetical protein
MLSHIWSTSQPRDWLHHVLVSGKKDPETSSIARFNEMSEHLADWFVPRHHDGSVILLSMPPGLFP